MKSSLSHVCLIAVQDIESEFIFIRNLGAGSQAQVDLYKRKQSASSFLASKQVLTISNPEYKADILD